MINEQTLVRKLTELRGLCVYRCVFYCPADLDGINSRNNTRRIVYKGWLTRDEIWRLVDFGKILRDGDYFFK